VTLSPHGLHLLDRDGGLPALAGVDPALLRGLDAVELALPAETGLELGEDAQHVEEALTRRAARVDRLFGGSEIVNQNLRQWKNCLLVRNGGRRKSRRMVEM
jgi:hypothetical protein